MNLVCVFCGDPDADCGTFTENDQGDVVHVGPCCLDAFTELAHGGALADMTTKYAAPSIATQGDEVVADAP